MTKPPKIDPAAKMTTADLIRIDMAEMESQAAIAAEVADSLAAIAATMKALSRRALSHHRAVLAARDAEGR